MGETVVSDVEASVNSGPTPAQSLALYERMLQSRRELFLREQPIGAAVTR